MKVCIFDIKRFAVHDGPGIRTTVFFKGCPLECRWCHNPEGIDAGIERFSEKISFDGVEILRETEVGRWIVVDELMDELERDRVYMEESGGGISFSGGEPLHQPEALFRLLGLARERNLHTTVDTSGYTSAENMEKVSDMADLLLYDLKSMDAEKHRKYTGVSNDMILANLRRALKGTAAVIIRIPVVSGFNDRDTEIGAMLEYLVTLNGIRAVDILPYHPYGTHKYRRFKKENRQNGFRVPEKERIEAIRKQFSKAGLQVGIGG
jgi:pyruvate formate lyase activating enzyme